MAKTNGNEWLTLYGYN